MPILRLIIYSERNNYIIIYVKGIKRNKNLDKNNWFLLFSFDFRISLYNNFNQ